MCLIVVQKGKEFLKVPEGKGIPYFKIQGSKQLVETEVERKDLSSIPKEERMTHEEKDVDYLQD